MFVKHDDFSLLMLPMRNGSYCSRWRPYRVECTGSLPTSEVKRRRARLVLGWGTAREDLRVLPALFALLALYADTVLGGSKAIPRYMKVAAAAAWRRRHGGGGMAAAACPPGRVKGNSLLYEGPWCLRHGGGGMAAAACPPGRVKGNSALYEGPWCLRHGGGGGMAAAAWYRGGNVLDGVRTMCWTACGQKC